jgi:PAS domain-containing protein
MTKEPKNKKLDPEVTRIILESISDGVFTVDHNWKITSFNRAAEEITGISGKKPSAGTAGKCFAPTCASMIAP